MITEIHEAESAVSHGVELTKLNKFLKNEKISKVIRLKIYTQGNEFDVLKGGETGIAQRIIKAIHFEFNEINVALQTSSRDYWKALEGYKFYCLLPNELQEIKIYSLLSCEIVAF